MIPSGSMGGGSKAALYGLGALVLLAVFALVTMLVAMVGLDRLTPDMNPLTGFHYLWFYREDAGVQRWTAIGAVAGAALTLGLLIAMLTGRKRPLHGAARWANAGEIAKHGLRAKGGILLGRQGGSFLEVGGSEHVMLYAPTRSGKGVGVVVPNLLSWPHSVVVLDVKKENFELTAGFRAEHGQRVFLFDPMSPDGKTARFNPLGHIDRTDRTDTLVELQKLARMFFPTEGVKDPFWNESATTGFVGVGAYVAETEELPFTIGEIYRQLTTGNPRERFPALIAERAAADRPLSRDCAQALSDFTASSENTFSSIKQTITSKMNLWLNPRVDAATAESDFDLRELRTRRMSIYLGVTPDNLDLVAPLYNVFFQQLVDLNTRALPPVSSHQVLVLLDEFARLGHAGVIAKGFSYVAGYGLRLLPVLQSPAQLRAIYGPDVSEEIMTNCGVEVVFTPKELKTAQELSERLGYTTVKSQSRSRPMALGEGKRSVSESDQRRALMLPQELMQLSADKLIVLRGGMPAVLGDKIRFFKDRVFTARVNPAPDVEAAAALNAPQLVEPEAPVEPTLGTIAAELAVIRSAVTEIQQKMVDRPMTVEEAAGEAPLPISSLEPFLNDPNNPVPERGSSVEELEQWTAYFIDEMAMEPVAA